MRTGTLFAMAVVGLLAACDAQRLDACQVDVATLHQACTGSCLGCAECLTWCGIAGCPGSQHQTCEVSCAGGRACPAGYECRTVADGPADVCVDPAHGWP